jgi:hypothetical protein
MLEGSRSGSGSGSGSGSIPLTNGSGSGSRRSKTHVDPVDPDPDSDPQHCSSNYTTNYLHVYILNFYFLGCPLYAVVYFSTSIYIINKILCYDYERSYYRNDG